MDETSDTGRPAEPAAESAGPGTPAETGSDATEAAADGTVLAAPAKARHAKPPAKGAKRAKPVKKKGSFARELPVLLGIAFVLAILIKTFLVQAFYIPSGSMEETLLIGDRVLVNKLVYKFRDIHRGEIVVFNGEGSFTRPDPGQQLVAPPSNPVQRAIRAIGGLLGTGPSNERDFIKRVIGLPGDVVSCCDDQGRVVVNGVGLDEPYLFEDSHDKFGPVTVPEDRIFVLGDHRSRSSDSRAHLENHNGGVPMDKVIGRAFVVIWPIGHAKGLRVPASLEKQPEEQSLPGTPWALTATPPVLGLAGALPLTLLRRRRRLRRAAR